MPLNNTARKEIREVSHEKIYFKGIVYLRRKNVSVTVRIYPNRNNSYIHPLHISGWYDGKRIAEKVKLEKYKQIPIAPFHGILNEMGYVCTC